MSLAELKKEVESRPWPYTSEVFQTLYVRGYDKNPYQADVLRRADAVYELFTAHEKKIYENDIILGSIAGILGDDNVRDENAAIRYYDEIKHRNFWIYSDHFAPNYKRFLADGICGTRDKILCAMSKYKDDEQKEDFLKACLVSLNALKTVLIQYADMAEQMGKHDAAEACRYIANYPPKTFRQALQLVFMVHILFTYERRYAMAFGRMDQYLFPYYEADIKSDNITQEEAEEMLACTFYKLRERDIYIYGDDVCNIAIGGVKPEDGTDATNELSYAILHAVNMAHIPGPNLSARINKDTSMDFIDECLKVIGTGLGYPAMMNDDVNIPALDRYGIYDIKDIRDYCMVGCIENFIQGKQPPWSDGCYNTPKYLMYALYDGVNILTGEQESVHTGKAEDIKSMNEFVEAMVKHMEIGAANYVKQIHEVNNVDPIVLQQPYLSLFCDSCIEKGLDINMGGAVYPPIHGIGVMGVATMADSLAAIEKLVFTDKVMTLAQMRDILSSNFEGYEKEHKMMLDCPKYGNNDDFVDKWAAWVVKQHADIFDKYRTYGGGPVYFCIASNIHNISAGREISATPDGRMESEPMSDAASPMHGADINGPTAALLSLSKPDYRYTATGTVVNQKYPPEMFTDDEKRKKLGALIRVYFNRGGQEIQINATSTEVLRDAMVNPDKYRSMVVRVSGFSAFYTKLGQDVQLDILKRTEHESI